MLLVINDDNFSSYEELLQIIKKSEHQKNTKVTILILYTVNFDDNLKQILEHIKTNLKIKCICIPDTITDEDYIFNNLGYHGFLDLPNEKSILILRPPYLHENNYDLKEYFEYLTNIKEQIKEENLSYNYLFSVLPPFSFFTEENELKLLSELEEKCFEIIDDLLINTITTYCYNYATFYPCNEYYTSLENMFYLDSDFITF